MSEEKPSDWFQSYKQDTFDLATSLLLIAQEADSNLKIIFRSTEDGETPVGVVLAFSGGPEYLNAILDVVDMVNASHDIQNAAKFFSENAEE